MNLKLIEKLAKLANNNPNENEANLAARKVCKLLVEGDFKFNIISESVIDHAKRQSPVYSYGTSPSQNDWTKRYYTKPNPPKWDKSTVSSDQYDEMLKDLFNFATNGAGSKFYNRSKEKPKREKRPLKCILCGETIETAFVGPPQIYECHKCQWNKEFKER